ncbi:response regulator [Paracnuella aquatica]|nr:response regulator [Paracnuella aquatica]
MGKTSTKAPTFNPQEKPIVLQKPGDTAAPLRVLIAEDDRDDQEILKETMQEVDPSVEVVLVSSGLKAIKALEACPDGSLPHLLILDYNMPELNGAEVLETLARHQRYEGIPKVVLSTSSSPYYKASCMERGAQGYFTKPSSYIELEALIRDILKFCA